MKIECMYFLSIDLTMQTRREIAEKIFKDKDTLSIKIIYKFGGYNINWKILKEIQHGYISTTPKILYFLIKNSRNAYPNLDKISNYYGSFKFIKFILKYCEDYLLDEDDVDIPECFCSFIDDYKKYKLAIREKLLFMIIQKFISKNLTKLLSWYI